MSDDDSDISQTENIAHSDSNDDSGMDTPKKNPQLKDFDKCGKTQRREMFWYISGSIHHLSNDDSNEVLIWWINPR